MSHITASVLVGHARLMRAVRVIDCSDLRESTPAARCADRLPCQCAMGRCCCSATYSRYSWYSPRSADLACSVLSGRGRTDGGCSARSNTDAARDGPLPLAHVMIADRPTRMRKRRSVEVP